MKVFQIVCIFICLLALSFGANATWGTKATNSVIAYTQEVWVNHINNQYQTANVNFPTNGQINTKQITYINVVDGFMNSSGAVATLQSGGPGSTFATVNLKSQIGQGINSTVEFYVKSKKEFI